MGIFSTGRKTNKSSSSEPQEWKYFTSSKYSNKQVVLDYMADYGIRIVKLPSGLYYITHKGCSDFDGFMAMTGYRAKIGSPLMVAVVLDSGEVKDFFMSLNEAYDALETLYYVIRNTPGEDDF